MAQQQWGIYSPASPPIGRERDPYFADGENEEMEDEEVPWLTSSQSTVSSSGGVTPGGNKRRFLEDEEGAYDVATSDVATSRKMALGERVLAVPRGRKLGKAVAGGQENVGIVGEDADFPEAEFLDYTLVDEVEMGGC